LQAGLFRVPARLKLLFVTENIYAVEIHYFFEESLIL